VVSQFPEDLVEEILKDPFATLNTDLAKDGGTNVVGQAKKACDQVSNQFTGVGQGDAEVLVQSDDSQTFVKLDKYSLTDNIWVERVFFVLKAIIAAYLHIFSCFLGEALKITKAE
jgi:hypothetical protein